jgi:2-keto-4-pentenoate hydratase/2-oxohepta-3-ene-1,7-dioic acid hydratase in catechol pathway
MQTNKMKALYITKENEIFMSPDSAIVNRGKPWFLPDDAPNWHAKLLIGTCISRLGMHISEKFASRYYQNFITAIHTYAPLAEHSVRWCRDGALVTGPGEISASTNDALNITIGDNSIVFDPDSLRNSINAAVAYASSYITLKTGDLILLDTDLPDFILCEGVDFDVLVGNNSMIHFKTR